MILDIETLDAMLLSHLRGFRHPQNHEAPDSSPSTGASSCLEVGMVNRCDRCCQRARTWWALIDDTHDGDHELYLCRHHGNQHGDRLVATGWVLVAEEAIQPSGAV